MPPMRGIFISVTTIAGDHCVAFSRPSTPSRAVSLRKPHEETISARPERSFSSSSTINTFSWLIGLKSVSKLRYSLKLAVPAKTRLTPHNTRQFQRLQVCKGQSRLRNGLSHFFNVIFRRNNKIGLPSHQFLQSTLLLHASVRGNRRHLPPILMS